MNKRTQILLVYGQLRYNSNVASCMSHIAYLMLHWCDASYTLCTNLDKSGANHETCIVYTQVIRIRFVADLIRDSRFVNSQPLTVFARTIKGHELDLQ